MIEFAIILIVLVILVAGGIELSIAAYNGHATSEASRAGVSDWISKNVHASGGLVYALGDHDDATQFSMPTCQTGTSDIYDDGLPADSITRGGSALYLYNPMPIDVTDCQGNDDNGTPGDVSDDLRARASVLVGGRADNSVIGLPRLNQKLYAQYRKACWDAGSSVWISCKPVADGGDFDASNAQHRILMKLPGRYDLTTPAVPQLGQLTWDETATQWNSLPDKPVFELTCYQGGGSQVACNDVGFCRSASVNTCGIRVKVGYRHVFDTFMPMVDWKRPVDAVAAHSLDDSWPAGVVGSELTLGNARKAFKDFIGCYEAEASLVYGNASGVYDSVGGYNHFNSFSCN